MIRLLRGRGFRVGYRPEMSWRELVGALRAGGVAILHVDGDHFIVVHGVDGDECVRLADPSLLRCLRRRTTRMRFLARWSRWGLLVSGSLAGSNRRLAGAFNAS